jgi:hypothetical protein
MYKQNFTQLQKETLFLLTFFFQICTLLMANPTSRLSWNSNTGVYEVFLEQNEAQKIHNVQISIQLPTQNLFIFDIEGTTEMPWNVKRLNAPLESPSADFFLFSTPQINTVQPSQKLFSFKIVGVNQSGAVILNILKNAQFSNGVVNIQSQALIDDKVVAIYPQDLDKKTPIVSYSNISNKNAQRFSLNTNYLKEEIQICSNWLEKSGQIYFNVYDMNGKLAKTLNMPVESGAQQFHFSYGDLPNGTYFIKAKFGNWESIINDGFVKIDDFNAVSK